MLNEIHLWPDKLRAGQATAIQFLQTYGDQLKSGNYTNIAFAGMGGSAIAGHIMANFLERNLGRPTLVLDSPLAPYKLDSQTLLCVMSYSGNTWEIGELIKRYSPELDPAQIVVLSHGGALESFASLHKIAHARMPQSLTPRSALGIFIGFLIEICSQLGLLKAPYAQELAVGQLANHMETACKAYQPAQFEPFIQAIQKLPFFHIWGVKHESGAAAYRAQTQFNENGKIGAVQALYPELCHNLLVGLTGPSSVGHPPVLLFATDFLEEKLKKALAVTERIVQEHGVTLYKPSLLGNTYSTQFFSMIAWADLASYYAGIARGQEVTPVYVIETLKNRLSAAGVTV